MDDSIANNDVKPQALRYLHRVHKSMPLKQRSEDNESRTRHKSRSIGVDNVSMKDPVKSNTEARDAAEGAKPAAEE